MAGGRSSAERRGSEQGQLAREIRHDGAVEIRLQRRIERRLTPGPGTGDELGRSPRARGVMAGEPPGYDGDFTAAHGAAATGSGHGRSLAARTDRAAVARSHARARAAPPAGPQRTSVSRANATMFPS
ncbi:hypothetical protein FBY35_4368 [Streptomyces sp. SLBN-118]|nr:hypothetical protein FBY35_4368 [Streptomyces sp. SLBN-118]